MKLQNLPIPGLVLGVYPERRVPVEDAAGERSGRAPLPLLRRGGARRYAAFMALVKTLDASAASRETEAVDAQLRRVRAGMARDGLTDPLIAEAFVIVKRACVRELGLHLFEAQILAARIMLDQRLAEMATGEGKTIAAAVCAATAALAGIPVHVVTANDYLVARDAGFLRPLYSALGVSVTSVTQALTREGRYAAYDGDVVYCTASELVFDYLRDGLVRERSASDLQRRVAALGCAGVRPRETLLRGLCMAIVDEADSVLIDDARMPLILSERRSNEGEREYLKEALTLAAQLTQTGHFLLHRHGMYAELTAAGLELVERCSANAPWRNRIYREETLCTALAALYLYERDRHYVLRDGKVNIIDQSTGRLATGRVWSRGLHLLIELKEHCEPSGDTAAVAQITYQRFFQRYLALSGMSGTLTEARGELASVYGLPVVKVPLTRPDKRTVRPTRLYGTRKAQWEAVVDEAIEVSRAGRPVLVGTDSVAESEEISRRLSTAGVPHAVLNARQDHDEARIVAEAGSRGRITVSTNIAGRGTDIAIAPEVAAIGGLHVISCQHNATRRVDRQLLGRCARRGDPGSAQTLLALEQPLIASFAPRWLKGAVGDGALERPRWLVQALVRFPQRLAEHRQRAERRQLLERDQRAARGMSFGRKE
jgi:preprotein translocase subunit SecA